MGREFDDPDIPAAYSVHIAFSMVRSQASRSARSSSVSTRRSNWRRRLFSSAQRRNASRTCSISPTASSPEGNRESRGEAARRWPRFSLHSHVLQLILSIRRQHILSMGFRQAVRKALLSADVSVTRTEARNAATPVCPHLMFPPGRCFSFVSPRFPASPSQNRQRLDVRGLGEKVERRDPFDAVSL